MEGIIILCTVLCDLIKGEKSNRQKNNEREGFHAYKSLGKMLCEGISVFFISWPYLTSALIPE
jgi:hypothetical protein